MPSTVTGRRSSQVKHGNKEPTPKPAKAEAWTDPDRAPARDAAWLDSKTEEELADLDEEFDDDRFLDAYRCAAVGCLPLLAEDVMQLANRDHFRAHAVNRPLNDTSIHAAGTDAPAAAGGCLKT